MNSSNWILFCISPIGHICYVMIHEKYLKIYSPFKIRDTPSGGQFRKKFWGISAVISLFVYVDFD